VRFAHLERLGVAGSMRLRGRARERAEADAVQAAAQAQLRAEIQTLFEAQARAQATTLETLQGLRDDVVSHDAEVVRVLELAVNVCDHVIECVEADRVERQAIVEALGALASAINNATPIAPPIAAPSNTGPHLIGGRVFAGDDRSAIVHEPAPMIELNEAHDRSVEVKCRYEGRWVDGFEVCETIHTDAGERYRLRRLIDGTILPELFAAGDIRHVETFEELEPAVEVPAPRRIWSRL
jgi:hypothetical protein